MYCFWGEINMNMYKLKVTGGNNVVNRIIYDFKFVMLNCFVNRIPCWHLRKSFYLLCGMSIGKKTRIGINTIIFEPQKVCIGDRTIINDNCYIDARGGLNIGNDVSISAKSCIYTTSHDVDSSFFEYKEYACKVENNVWLGSNSLIIGPSLIKSNTVIGAGSVFKGVSEKNGIYIGNPAKLKKIRKIKQNYEVDFKAYFR